MLSSPCEIWIAIDDDGHYEVGTERAQALERYADAITDEQGPLLLIRGDLTLPTPAVIVMTGELSKLHEQVAELKFSVKELKE